MKMQPVERAVPLRGLRASDRPVWMRPPKVEVMCRRIHRAFREEAATLQTVTTFRLHPTPEHMDGKRRRSVREAECVYIQATFGDFFDWANCDRNESALSERNPLRQLELVRQAFVSSIDVLLRLPGIEDLAD